MGGKDSCLCLPQTESYFVVNAWQAERGTVSEVLGQRVRNVGVNTEQAATAAASTAATSVATTVQKEEELPRES